MILTSQGLGLINEVVAIINDVLVVAFVIAIWRGRRHVRMNTIAASFALVLYAILAAVTGISPALGGLGDLGLAVQSVALALRLAILLVMLAWCAVTIQSSIDRRWPVAARHIDRLIGSRKEHR